jgi:hypothetical protein
MLTLSSCQQNKYVSKLKRIKKIDSLKQKNIYILLLVLVHGHIDPPKFQALIYTYKAIRNISTYHTLLATFSEG